MVAWWHKFAFEMALGFDLEICYILNSPLSYEALKVRTPLYLKLPWYLVVLARSSSNSSRGVRTYTHEFGAHVSTQINKASIKH